MSESKDNTVLMRRVRELVEIAVAALDPFDRDERIAYCREHDQHGVRMFPDSDGLLEFRWGGRRLAMVRAADLDSDAPLQAEFQCEIPDTIEGLFGGDTE